MLTSSWWAALPLRSRVSMSAIGSVMLMSAHAPLPARLGDAGQLAGVGELAHADPAQAELAQHRPRPPAALAARVGPHLELGGALGLGDQGLLCHSDTPEGESEGGEQRPALLVGLGAGHHGDVHAPDLLDLVVVDLGEDQLLGQPEGEVAVAVEGPGVETAEVADAGQDDRDQPVQELPHPVAAQGDLGPDRLALTDFEAGDGLLGLGDQRLLPGDLGQVANRAVKQARLADGLADAHVDHDLERPGHLHDVAELELVLEPLLQLGTVARLEPGHLPVCGGLRHRLVFLLELRAGAGADPDLDAVLVAVGDPGRLAVVRAQQLDVGGVDPGLLLGDAAGLAAPLGRADLLVPLDAVDPLDQHLVAARIDLEHPAGDPEVLAGHDHHAVVLAYLHGYSTSGARLMIFMKRFSRSSRPTGPKMRVPRGFCWSLMITAAFSSKRM